MTTTAPEATLAVEAATATAIVLPSVHPLTVSTPQPGNDNVGAFFQGAVVARLSHSVTARIGVLVGEELVAALAASPTPGLMLSAAVQPAIDAAAGILGTTAEPAVEIAPGSVAAEFGGSFTVVPLMGTGFAAAVLFTDDALVSPGGTPVPEEVATVAEIPVVPSETVSVVPSAPAAPTGSPVSAPAPSYAAAAPSAPSPVARRGIEMLHGVDMELTVELGRTRMPVRDLLALAPGDVLELNRAAGSPADLLVNGQLIARGEVVVVDEDFGLRITEIVEASAG